jgi:hypothetical protein
MKNILSLFAGVALGVLIMVLIGHSSSPAQVKKTNLKITGPKDWGSLDFSVEGDGVDFEKVLNGMFSNTFYRAGALGWLEEKQKIVPLESDSLATKIETDLCDPFPDQPLDLKIRKKRECAAKPAVKGLRDLAFNRKRPFHYVGNVGRMGVPELTQNKPTKGYANACKPGDYYGKRLQIGNPENNAVVEVLANGPYACTDAANFPDIQLSPEDARTLFPNAKLGQTEPVVIVPIE